MSTKKLICCAVLILGLSVSGVISSDAASSKYAAKVNGKTVKSTTLDFAVENFCENQKMMGVNIEDEDKKILREKILDELISAELLYQESKKAGLGNLTKKVDEQFDSIKKGFKTEKEFNNLMKERGLSEKELRESIEKGVYIETFLETEVYSDITIDETEKIQEYDNNKDKLNVPEQVNASHILVRVSKEAAEEEKNNLRTKIEGLRNKAAAGEDFAELARANSEDGSASVGGNLGYFKRGDMVKPFEDAAFGLKPGEVSDIVETDFGYHIIKLNDIKPAHLLAYEEVEKEIERFLLNKHRIAKLSEYVEKLRKDAKIERF
jgi:peptidyl-prolyl cis-trans isomerase C